MKKLSLLIIILSLSACASQIMRGYIGKDVREVMLDYGTPANAFDMGDGRRVFQWVMGSSYTTPVTATTTGSVNTYGPTSWVKSNTTITGGKTINSKCIYTLFSRWNEEPSGWVVTGFKKPNFMCE